MIDSVVTVGMKWIDEDVFTEIMRYQVSKKTPTGYVHIWTTASVANMSIDNLSIVNKDDNPNLVEVEYASGLVTAPKDFDYKPLECVYEETGENGWSPYVLIPAVAAICAVVFVIAMFVKTRKERRGGDNDE